MMSWSQLSSVDDSQVNFFIAEGTSQFQLFLKQGVSVLDFQDRLKSPQKLDPGLFV